MWGLCLECGISSGCGCHEPPNGGIKYIPRDHEKELEKWLADLADEVTTDRNI